ncbi:glycosyltransferase [Massilia antarctica]|uniref:glycosyltransferase n=1 Tax=Massilia antarctica TaxID=2765360 RepID=UPI0006BB56DB|nr:glycosyltransferase [Massilia sp. H27-R4]MCY0915229.1 glycosyltransferase [Massilia sp. H27-R4]
MLSYDLISPKGGTICASRAQWLSGNEATTALWALELARRGHAVRVFSPQSPSEAADGVEWLPIEAFDKTEPADVVVSYRSPAILARLPQRVTSILFFGDRPAAGADDLGGAECDSLWFNSLVHWTMYRPFLRPGQRFHIGCCGYDASVFTPGAAVAAHRFINSASPYRSLGNLLSLWPRIRQALPDAELHLTGGYELWGYSPEHARELLAKDVPHAQVEIPGIVRHGVLCRDDYAALLKSCAFYLYPTTYHETCCIAVLEASACGVIPIISSVAALKERVIDAASGVLVPESAHWENDFLRCTVALAQDADARSAMSFQAARHATLFTARRVIDELESLVRAIRAEAS